MRNANFACPLTSVLFLVLLFNLPAYAQTPDCNAPFINTTSTGNPTITAKSKNEVYFNANVPTFREMLGVNTQPWELAQFSSFTGAGSIFSHFRVYLANNRDYWNFQGDPGSGHYPSAVQVPRGNMQNLRLVVDGSSVPLSSERQPTAKFIYPERIAGTNKIRLIEVAAPTYENPYTSYMNSTWINIKNGFDNISPQVKFTITLELITPNFDISEEANYQFPNKWFLKDDWGNDDDQRKLNAKAYATMFARAYSPKESDCSTCPKMVDILEIGNEPWGYSDPMTYQKIVEGMVEGINEYYGAEVANKIKLLPAAFQAHHTEIAGPASVNQILSWKDYLGTKIPLINKCTLDGINLHLYSDIIGNNTVNTTAYPEMVSSAVVPNTSKMYHIKNAWQWLKDNTIDLNKKNTYVSEFGWDSDGCLPDKSVGYKTQAFYTIRNLLMMSRYGVKRATFYQLKDDNVGCGYAYFSSGVWDENHNPKYIYKALENTVNKIGDCKFHYALREDANDVFAYILEQNNQPKYMVAWLARDIKYQSNHLSNPINGDKSLNDIITSGLNATDMGVTPIGSLKNINIAFNGRNYIPDINSSNPCFRLIGESETLTANQVYDPSTQSYWLSAIPVVIPIIEDGIVVTSPNSCNIVSCPTNIERTTTSTCETVGWEEPRTTDNCAFTISSSPTANLRNGDCFPIGTTTINYRTNNTNGTPNNCSFTVKVSEGTRRAPTEIDLSISINPIAPCLYTPFVVTVLVRNPTSQTFTNVQIDVPFDITAGVVTGLPASTSLGAIWNEWCIGGSHCCKWTIPSLPPNGSAILTLPLFGAKPGVKTITATWVNSSPPLPSPVVAPLTFTIIENCLNRNEGIARSMKVGANNKTTAIKTTPNKTTSAKASSPKTIPKKNVSDKTIPKTPTQIKPNK
jgi:hypothetical protein